MTAAGDHLESLDALRGLTIAGMILVNNPGSWDAMPPLLVHAAWNGCTLADLVFPFFLFVLGAAMPFAFARRLSAGGGRAALTRHVWRRAATLVGLGLVLNAVAAAPALAQIRIPGVLQRIGLVYLAAAFLVLHTGTRTRIAAIAGLLLGHWALLVLVPFGGHAAGLVAPGRNLAATVDRLAFGTHTLTAAGDPEGLLGTVPAIASALIGSLAGDGVRATGAPGRRLGLLVAGGGLLLALGLAWSFVWPLNKPLWSGSYALATGGLASLLFALAYLLVDVRGRRRPVRPLVWLGVNPLAIYVLAELAGHLLDEPWLPAAGGWTTTKSWLFWDLLQPAVDRGLGVAGAAVAFAALTVVFWTAVAGLLYRRGIRIPV